MRRDYNREALERMGRESGLDDLEGAYDVEIPNEHAAHLIDNDADMQNADPLIRGPFRDDFVEQMEQKARSVIGPRGEVLNDDFDQKFQVQEEERSELEHRAPFVRKNPPSAIMGTLGGIERVTLADAGRNPVGVLFWQADAEIESTMVTITISPVIPEVDGAGTLIYRPFARVTFGTRCAHLVEVDVGRGIQFNLATSALQVAVGLDDGSTVTSMQLQASLGFEPSMRTAPLTRTLYGATQDGGSTVEFLVPNFAKNVLLHRATVGTAMRLDFKDSAGNVIYGVALAANATMTDPITLSNDIALIDVVNTAGGGTFSGAVRLIFGLTL